MGRIITICNQKGGVGKTTTAVNLASFLALSHNSVLLIDADPQGNATSGTGVDRKTIQQSLYHTLIGEADLAKIVVSTPISGLSLVPSDLHLAGAEVELVPIERREYRLKDVLAPLRERYDYVFIDTPPSLSLLTVNALTAAETVLIPVQCEYYALEGLTRLLKTIELVKNNLNPKLEIEGVLLTMADLRTKLSQKVISEAREFFKDKVYGTVIPRNIRLSEAPSFGKPIVLYDRKSIGAEKYRELAEEFLRKERPLPEETSEIYPVRDTTWSQRERSL